MLRTESNWTRSSRSSTHSTDAVEKPAEKINHEVHELHSSSHNIDRTARACSHFKNENEPGPVKVSQPDIQPATYFIFLEDEGEGAFT